MPIISFASLKGGAGRTTSAIVLATELARKHRVVLIDADPARRLMSWGRKRELPPRLQVQASGGEGMIREEINHARAQSGFAILDLEGASTRLNAYAMGESDLVIIPMGDDHQDAEGAIETLAELQRVARGLDREIPVRILFTRTRDGKSQLEKSLNAQMRSRVPCFIRELRNMPAYSALHGYGGALLGMGREGVQDAPKASAHAGIFADEVEDVMAAVASRTD